MRRRGGLGKGLKGMDKRDGPIVVAKDCVWRDLTQGNIYHRLLFRWMNGIIESKNIQKNAGAIIHYVGDALETKYVLALSKLFAGTKEQGLWKLILLVKNIPEAQIDSSLEQMPSFLRARPRQVRADFLENFNSNVDAIKAIREKIKPLRNVQRAHNSPLTPESAPVLWKESKEWLTFAEELYVQAMDGICEGAIRVGHFLPAEMDSQIDWFISMIRELEAGAVGVSRMGDSDTPRQP